MGKVRCRIPTLLIDTDRRSWCPQLRTIAIAHLSDLSLSPSRKIQLGREYRVPKWFLEGIQGIATAEDICDHPVEDLATALGWETTARILWYKARQNHIKDNCALDMAQIRCFRDGCGLPVSFKSKSGARCPNGHGLSSNISGEGFHAGTGLRAYIPREGILTSTNVQRDIKDLENLFQDEIRLLSA